MHSVLWASILASAAVAVVTTLLVEYLAKPALEARKDRILERSRDKRAGVKNIRRAIYVAARVEAFMASAEKGFVQPEYVDKARAELSELMFNAYQAIYAPKQINSDWIILSASVERFGATSHRATAADLEEYLCSLRTQLGNFRLYFTTPKWDLRERRSLIRKINSHPSLSSNAYEARKKSRLLLSPEGSPSLTDDQ